MNELDISKAIQYLKPTAQFSFEGTDYSSIKWDVLEGDAPTQAEINAAIEQVKIDEAQAEATKAAQKQALLSRLGITEEEAKLLLGGN
jgi:hypothetical protein